MQHGNLPEVKHKMSHYFLINPPHTVPSAGISSVPSPRYATCREMALCVSLYLSPSPPPCPWLSTVIGVLLHSHKYREVYRKLYC